MSVKEENQKHRHDLNILIGLILNYKKGEDHPPAESETFDQISLSRL